VTELVECIPNFSEGRREEVITGLVGAVAQAGGQVLDVQRDASHNRCVVTFVGELEAALEAAFAATAVAAERIDLRQHRGEHPRMGAADVIPFVPFADLPMERCVALAHRLGRRIAAELHIPVYYYGEAARRPERRELEQVRRKGFEELRETIQEPDRQPDDGPAAVHPSAGAVAVGARLPLLAYNVNLRTSDVTVARGIARKIRASSGGFPKVKALGFALEERGLTQVSMNLTDYRVTGIWKVFTAIVALAREQGVEVDGSEIVGTLPLEAAAQLVRDAVEAHAFTAEQILEKKVWQVPRA
jgi:glutamate formiminotransferase